MTASAKPAPTAEQRVRVVVERIDNCEWLVTLPDGNSIACESHMAAQRTARNYFKRSLSPAAPSVIEWRI